MKKLILLWLVAFLRFLRTAAPVGVVVLWVVSGALWVAGYWRHVSGSVQFHGSSPYHRLEVEPRAGFDSGAAALDLYVRSMRPRFSTRVFYDGPALGSVATVQVSPREDHLRSMRGGWGISWSSATIKVLWFGVADEGGDASPPCVHVLWPHWLVQLVLTGAAAIAVRGAIQRRRGRRFVPVPVERRWARMRRTMATAAGIGCLGVAGALLVVWPVSHWRPVALTANRSTTYLSGDEEEARRVGGYVRRMHTFVELAESGTWRASARDGVLSILLGMDRGWLGYRESESPWVRQSGTAMFDVGGRWAAIVAQRSNPDALMIGLRREPRRVGSADPEAPLVIHTPCWTMVAPLTVAAALLLRPWWRHRRAARWARDGRCAECGYQLRGNISGVCPECGTACGDAAPTGGVRHRGRPVHPNSGSSGTAAGRS